MDYIDCWDFIDKIYCFSVDQRQDRRQTARQEFSRVGLLDRVEFAIVEKHPRNPEQGIYESHLLCMEKGLAADAETILIFEDDILFRGFKEADLRRACSWLAIHPGWNALFLGCMVSRIDRTDTNSLVRAQYRCLAHGYAVSRTFAEHIIQIPWQGTPYDGLLKQQNNNFFALHPMVAFQSPSPTDNHTLVIDRMRRSFGGLQRLQLLNELFHYHKKAIVVSHGVALVLVIVVGWLLFNS